jgi:hypothetical protein
MTLLIAMKFTNEIKRIIDELTFLTSGLISCDTVLMRVMAML